MEEKERFEVFGEHCIKDNSQDARCQLLDTYKACVILNQQDKRIKELEEENKELKDYTENTANLIDELTEDSVFASTQLAIEELEKLLKLIKKEEFPTISDGWFIKTIKLVDYIDNQIKELKKGVD